jgi:phage host-nuclease inhibitor protein Gam
MMDTEIPTTPDDFDLEALASLAPEDFDEPGDWDEARVEKILAGYAALQRKRDRLNAIWTERLHEIDARRIETLQPMENRLAFLEDTLHAWALRKREESDVTSTKLPSGKVGARKGQPKVDVKKDSDVADRIHDGSALVGIDTPWVREMIRTKPEVHEIEKDVVKKLVKDEVLIVVEEVWLVVNLPEFHLGGTVEDGLFWIDSKTGEKVEDDVTVIPDMFFLPAEYRPYIDLPGEG